MAVTSEAVFVAAGALATAGCLELLARRLPAGERVGPPVRPEVEAPRSPSQLVRLERIVGWSEISAVDAYAALRPVLVEIADARLMRRGLRMGRDEAEARRLLGELAWAWIRPDRPPPRSDDAPGLPARELEQIVDALEAI